MRKERDTIHIISNGWPKQTGKKATDKNRVKFDLLRFLVLQICREYNILQSVMSMRQTEAFSVRRKSEREKRPVLNAHTTSQTLNPISVAFRLRRQSVNRNTILLLFFVCPFVCYCCIESDALLSSSSSSLLLLLLLLSIALHITIETTKKGIVLFTCNL